MPTYGSYLTSSLAVSNNFTLATRPATTARQQAWRAYNFSPDIDTTTTTSTRLHTVYAKPSNSVTTSAGATPASIGAGYTSLDKLPTWTSSVSTLTSPTTRTTTTPTLAVGISTQSQETPASRVSDADPVSPVGFSSSTSTFALASSIVRPETTVTSTASSKTSAPLTKPTSTEARIEDAGSSTDDMAIDTEAEKEYLDAQLQAVLPPMSGNLTLSDLDEPGAALPPALSYAQPHEATPEMLDTIFKTLQRMSIYPDDNSVWEYDEDELAHPPPLDPEPKTQRGEDLQGAYGNVSDSFAEAFAQYPPTQEQLKAMILTDPSLMPVRPRNVTEEQAEEMLQTAKQDPAKWQEIKYALEDFYNQAAADNYVSQAALIDEYNADNCSCTVQTDGAVAERSLVERDQCDPSTCNKKQNDLALIIPLSTLLPVVGSLYARKMGPPIVRYIQYCYKYNELPYWTSGPKQYYLELPYLGTDKAIDRLGRQPINRFLRMPVDRASAALIRGRYDSLERLVRAVRPITAGNVDEADLSNLLNDLDYILDCVYKGELPKEKVYGDYLTKLGRKLVQQVLDDVVHGQKDMLNEIRGVNRIKDYLEKPMKEHLENMVKTYEEVVDDQIFRMRLLTEEINKFRKLSDMAYRPNPVKNLLNTFSTEAADLSRTAREKMQVDITQLGESVPKIGSEAAKKGGHALGHFFRLFHAFGHAAHKMKKFGDLIEAVDKPSAAANAKRNRGAPKWPEPAKPEQRGPNERPAPAQQRIKWLDQPHPKYQQQEPEEGNEDSGDGRSDPADQDSGSNDQHSDPQNPSEDSGDGRSDPTDQDAGSNDQDADSNDQDTDPSDQNSDPQNPSEDADDHSTDANTSSQEATLAPQHGQPAPQATDGPATLSRETRASGQHSMPVSAPPTVASSMSIPRSTMTLTTTLPQETVSEWSTITHVETYTQVLEPERTFTATYPVTLTQDVVQEHVVTMGW